ncbi:hypothetical protein RIF29_39318 [Crotalaria pallida]|uniref:Uncharacterized protein n=1 Tax=Crotalaria pallida TaxID=3830 RepID=A0AAN9E6C7_CROPI
MDKSSSAFSSMDGCDQHVITKESSLEGASAVVQMMVANGTMVNGVFAALQRGRQPSKMGIAIRRRSEAGDREGSLEMNS